MLFEHTFTSIVDGVRAGFPKVHWLCIDGWLRTGDMGYLDEDAYLYLVAARHGASR